MSRATNQKDTGNKNVDSSKKLPTVLSLCTGYGGIERGLELAGFEHRVIAHVEIEAFAAANLVAKMEEGQMVPAPVWTDLKTLPVHCFRDRIDVLTGGYPCQPFSAAGKRRGADDPRHLWPHIKRHIDTIRPVRCFFENVEGHISLGLREVIGDLESLGYATTWGVFSAAEAGAPHQRKRVYILGDANCDRRKPDTRRGALSNKEWNGEGEEQRRNHQPEGVDRAGYVADADNKRQSQSQGSEQNVGRWIKHGSETMADTHGSQQQRGRVSIGVQPEYSKPDIGGDTRGQQTAPVWLPEPNVGRVADGGVFRVDRLRLLGNGVVPQTAAIAWVVLCDQLQQKIDKTTNA